ncbi:UDP-N-acetylmuramoyl-L-alanyl-D-glutamate--2,6-diaminopimelate ligase [Candidatus Dojkabacteria bacterium]|uniref:UDP-N-acetylmuramoyl-L-alanyl-D-glutamate--2, 6-diaminopimelate ligase n=1 Tax=Candidatus Dojkabacteria bacterium TaxID=2099670 RepID=A0A955I6I9_9BACT|nr:UDP-N-acetylmuramoyl-L-alanyl-D-glutamate--2,6-diaminopimelate ligase [Candidatus Dojkabacteria bacterium]
MQQSHPIQKAKNLLHLGQAIYANYKYDFPSKKLKILGVTGTDGKTTSTLMLYHILKEENLKVGYISTIGAKIGDQDLDTGLHVTTPDPWMVPKYLDQMVKEGVEYVVLESTSNGFQQNRLWGIEFDGGIITNIKSDHLDYHGTWENYAKAKFQLVKQIKNKGLIVLNKEDKNSFEWIKEQISSQRLDVNMKEVSASQTLNIKHSINGLTFVWQSLEFELHLIGKYNLENALGVIALASEIMPLDVISKHLKTFKAPKGRMEVIKTEPFSVIIDFAHTPNSLESALNSLKELKNSGTKIITVFGCAGMRDKERRKMGEVAARLSDVVILTAEDPRDEKLSNINNEILEYAKESKGQLVAKFNDSEDYEIKNLEELKSDMRTTIEAGNTPFFAFDADDISSRKDAISLAIGIAEKGDIVYLTGKAHEESLAFGAEQVEYPWSEHDVVKESLKSLNK